MTNASLVRGDALRLPFADESVDLIVTSPPYFSLRSYQDGGEHYPGQIGSEASPQEFIAALIAVTAECVRVLKPSGSMFVNLGDKYSGSGGHNNNGLGKSTLGASKGEGSRAAALAYAERMKERADLSKATRRQAPDRYNQDSGGIPAKSLMLLPERYRVAAVDQLGLIARAVIVWDKPNGLPESLTDRVRRSHEDWVHLTKAPRYYAAVDEIREEHAPKTLTHRGGGQAYGNDRNPDNNWAGEGKVREINPLGKLPGSVWRIPSEPLQVPAHVGVDHFAAYPQEWPRRLVLGWSPPGYCTECGQARQAVVDKRYLSVGDKFSGGNHMGKGTEATITGYRCACPTPDAPTRPSVVLDPFVGTGTTVMVARALGRYGVGVDLSADYLRLARWRVFDSRHSSKTEQRTWRERQGSLL